MPTSPNAAVVTVKLDIDQANLLRELLEGEDSRLATVRGPERDRAVRRRGLVARTRERL